MSSARYSRRGSPAVRQVRERLREPCNELAYSFWPDDVSWRDHKLFSLARAQRHNQIADICFLTLAAQTSDFSVSFDQSIALSSVHGALQKHLVLLWRSGSVAQAQAVTSRGKAASNCFV